MVWGAAMSSLCSIGKIYGYCVEAGVILRALLTEGWDVKVGLICLNYYSGAYSVGVQKPAKIQKFFLRGNQLLMCVLFRNF
jgi:hypothetical protein